MGHLFLVLTGVNLMPMNGRLAGEDALLLGTSSEALVFLTDARIKMFELHLPSRGLSEAISFKTKDVDNLVLS